MKKIAIFVMALLMLLATSVQADLVGLWHFDGDATDSSGYPQVTLNIVRRRIRGLKSPNRADPTRFIEHLWIEEQEGEYEEQSRMEE